ncbi:hypothetical protein PUN28_016266 [Cardiocondyla obscurior]|uniref:C2H2-type domain-containing protein n=1 Tax=Cardiocondyla obscurior TaxID=286306 RepID=A0AAW2EU82_9HYME
MRERTPSADDTPKRAPPAPSREAASADVSGSEASNDETIEGYHTAKFLSGIPSASGSASSSDRMVASTQSLEDLGVNHPANAAGSNADRQQHQQQQQQLLQERYGQAYRSSSAQTAQDKRSRLSNVINNLRKKVPDGAPGGSSSPRKEEDDRTSVERNLENLENIEKYLTVLNGVIKDNEEEEDKKAEKAKELEKQRIDANEEEEKEEEEDDSDDDDSDDDDEEEDEDRRNTAVKSESSNEGDNETAVVPRLEDSAMVENAEDTEFSETADCSNVNRAVEDSLRDLEASISKELMQSPSKMEIERLDAEAKRSSDDDRSVSRENKESRTLSAIIMDRLSEHQVEERANVDDGRGNRTRDELAVTENAEVQAICVELLSDLLSDVYRTIDDREKQKAEDCERTKKTDMVESRVEKTKDSSASVQELSVTSLHCSLPLDKVASVLQNCESVNSRLSLGSPPSLPSAQKLKPLSCNTPPVRLLCLYCDRKFLSMSLRQRHTERAHQLGGGRRSERNLRKPSQNCQYCSEKCADTLEALFQHMVGSHGDKYHACVQCSTRYSTREALVGHTMETHGGNAERINQPEKIKEGSPSCKEICSQNIREKVSMSAREKKSEEKESEDQGDSQRSDSSRTKLIATRESIDNPASPEFDSSFYSNVSCNVRENLLHHLDGKLQTISGPSSSTCMPPIAISSSTAVTTTTESKSPQQQPQQSYHEHNQIQFPIDISLTAATPVYSKNFSASEEHENSSEYARKAGRTSSGSRPRRVSFEKYNFPRKYDGREQWTCSIKDLSKFDISTQLSLRRKQQLLKERLAVSRLHQTPLPSCESTEVSLRDQEQTEPIVETAASNQDDADTVDAGATALDVVLDAGEPLPSEAKNESTIKLTAISSSSSSIVCTEFSGEFANFMRLRRREESDREVASAQEIVYAELSGEWSRMRIYICGACGSRHVTLKEMEDHKASTHPRILCSHFDLAGDQREYYKHLYLPGKDAPTDAARDASLTEMVCTKCTKSCPNVGELHRHMLECGGDQAWLLGLTGSGKKKCKWRPFGSRSRRRRQRGMKRNIQNSQTQPQPRVINVDRCKEKQAPAGPRVRPSDRESIQKMLANLPAKRATRKVLQDNVMRSQGRLRNVQTRTRPHLIGDNSSRISRNKAALRNKLLKNAKSIQRNRCRSDNIAAVIESVVRKCHEIEKKSDSDGDKSTENEDKEEAKEVNEDLSKATSKSLDQNDRIIRPRVVGRPRVLSKRRNLKNPQLQSKSGNRLAKAMSKFAKFKNVSETKDEGEETFSPKSTPKNTKTSPRELDKDDDNIDSKKMSTISGIKNKNKLAQSILKRKRSVDPVASLNASLKAKSQLRTQDGKFARNPNKSSSEKSFEMNTDDGKHKITNSIKIKRKLKAAQKLKKANLQLPRRVTRLSSDSDKMPTLEPVVQIISANEESDKSANDLPILSPVTSSSSLQDQKTSRISTKSVLKEKEDNSEINVDLETEKIKKSTRGRKPKQKTKELAQQKKINTVEENKVSKNNIKLKDDKVKGRKSSLNIVTSDESSKGETSKRETIVKKDLRLKKEEVTKETRSNVKNKIDRDSMKLSGIPFEVKKLLGSASKEDLLNTLELASNDTKRSLRQSTPRSKMLQANDKNPRELDDESDGSKDTSKKEKIELTRKSSRKSIEKKNDDKLTKTNLEKDSASNAIANLPQNEKSQHGKRDRAAKTKEIAIDNSDMESKTSGRQTRGSLSDAKNESSTETASDSFRKGSGLLGKRRSRNKSVDEDKESNTPASDEQTSSDNVLNEKEMEKEFGKICEREIESEYEKNSDNHLDLTVVNINLSHLQSETSNLSVDSGKENSLETPVNVHTKAKVGRPKKTWSARREKSSRKRSLNNVIGILTEGMNIPIEAQQNVQVLTVQTSLDNPERITRHGSAQQPSDGEGNVITMDSTFSELSVLAKSEEGSAENEVITTTSTTDNIHVDDEKNVHYLDETQENAFVDVSPKVTTKACSPATDIILDLSRRKTKGKGSFLEKIVSKIAKQKDALLEGEVGSLLDTAADELTSILEEVGSTLTDNAEHINSEEISHASNNNNDSNVTAISMDKELSAIAESKIQDLENNKSESLIFKHSTGSLEISDNLEENLITKYDAQSENQIKVNDVLNVETKNNDNVSKKVNDVINSIEESHTEETCDIINKESIIPVKITNTNKSSTSLFDISVSSPLITMQKENSEKDEKKGDYTKSRRKCNKRSENTNCSKKSKRKSLKIVEHCTDENNIQKELNEFSPKHSVEESLNTDTEITKSKSLQYTENEVLKNDLKSSSLEKDLKKTIDESSSEKLIHLSEKEVCENDKLMESLEKSVDEIISDKNDAITNVKLTKFNENTVDFSILSSEKNVECEKSVNNTQKKDSIDTNKPSKRTSKRKSQSALSITSPIDAATETLEVSKKSIHTTEKFFSSSIEQHQSSESTHKQLIEIGTTNEDSDISLEKLSSLKKIISEKNEETQNNAMPLKSTKRRNAKTKSLSDEHLDLPGNKSAKTPSKLDDEYNIEDSNKSLSENFKIPEVKDLPQSGKKRSSRKKLQSEDGRWNGGSVSEDSRANEEPADINETSNLIEKKIEEPEETEKCIVSEESNTKKLERSNSSGSIGLTSFSTKTRSMFKKKTQLSNEDLDSSIQSQSAESTDDLSESSCASESSYFRKKRFAKKKMKEEAAVDDIQDNVSLTDSTALKNDKQSLKEKMSKTKSLLDEHLDLSDADDIDIPMDIQASLENTEALENIEREFELTDTSSDLLNESIVKSMDDTENKDSSDTLEPLASNNHDSSDNSATPKKRGAGNFVVVHTKTGEILIVEKRKKLTKEAAKFFCDVCATSFTRKSSLKKHTLSQSHLLQLTKSTKDKVESVNSNTSENVAEEDDNDWKNDEESDQQIESISEDVKSHENIQQSLKLDDNYISYAANEDSTKSLMDLGNTRQMLEDKLLDEEICKITENMSHDEYVLTDHVTPEDSILSSMPEKPVQKKQVDLERGKNTDKKRNKSKKRNLAEEHLILDSPNLEKCRIDSNEFPKSTNDIIRASSSSCDHISIKETTEIIENIEHVSKKCMDIADSKNQSEIIAESLNEESNLKSTCNIDAKTEQQTDFRTTRRTHKKLSKVDNEERENTPALTETNRFSLRPRRSKNIQHYEESDIETDVFFMDTSTEINSDEIENDDAQKKQSEVEGETNSNALQENICVDTEDKNLQEIELGKSKTDSTNETKKRKRGRPRVKNRVISNSDSASVYTKSEVNGNDAVATGNLDESKIKYQKVDSHTEKSLEEISKAPHVDANAQPPKRSRGRPRKNPVLNNSSIQADNSSASQLPKSNHDEIKKKTDMIELCSETIVEEITSINSLISNAESLSAVQERTSESSLSETKTDLLNVEEIQNTEPSVVELAQKTKSTDNETNDTVLIKNCKTTLNSLSEKIEILTPLETNISIDDTKCEPEDKHDDDTRINIFTNLTIEPAVKQSPQITEQTTIDDKKSIESKTFDDDSFKIQERTDISEGEQTKLREEVPEEDVSKTKLLLESEDSEAEILITDNKSFTITSSHESQTAIDNLETANICNEKTGQLNSPGKKLSRKSMSKERETDRKRPKTSKGKRKKVKVAELLSDSENEDDKIESAASSKSKIVKSVFGRVISSEKADKVKEVLNDWVSRSEDDSDMSRSASEARFYSRGPAKFPENGHKKEKKHSSSEIKRDSERSPKKKGNDKCSGEVHGKTKNRKKREKDVESIPENRVESPTSPTKRRHRESKIRADEMIKIFSLRKTYEDVLRTLTDEDDEIEGITNQINTELNSKDKETKRHYEKELNKERTKDKNATSENWENLRVDHDVHGKSKNNSSHRKKNINERSSSPSQFNMFKNRRRENKTKVDERIWRAFDNENSPCLSDDQYLDETREVSNEQNSEIYEPKNLNRLDNSNSVKQKNDDVWESANLIDQKQTEVHSGRGKSKKDSNVNKISKAKTNKKILRDSDNEPSAPSREQQIKNEMQNDQTIRSVSELKNQSKTLMKDNIYESFAHSDSVLSKHMNKEQNNLLAHLDRSQSSKKNRKKIINENWQRSEKNLEFDQDIRRKDEESTISSHNNTLAGEIVKNQLDDLDENSQTNRKSDDNDNDDEEEEEEEEEESDNDHERRRMSPFYARETPDSSVENSSNEEGEEEEEEDGEEEHITHDDNSKKTNEFSSNEFSGEKIIIRSPSSGHRSDVVTIAPTDAMEDNALDVPREIESTMQPRQGKILNFDEELFVECCSRLKTSENELRGAKKIKLDHTESYHRRDDQPQGFRINRDRWRDVESQNSLGSLLESVNQLLGEEMYNSHDKSYRTRGSEQSSRSASPDASRIDNLGYEDSLDVAFEHNNKLRDKIQQRMRESENLIASTFSQKINDNDHPDDDKRDSVGNSYSSSIHEHEQLSTSAISNKEHESSPGHKNKMSSTLGGLQKALSNLLHSNGKHDHNGSAPMKLLAELACARAPTSTSSEDTTNNTRNHQSAKMVAAAVAAAAAAAAAAKDTPISTKRPVKTIISKSSFTKKTRNPIKELFERKKEINDRKELERSKAALVESNVQKQRKSKKNKKQSEFPLIRRNEHYGGMVEKKKRRGSLDRKGDSDRIKDVYEFDEEESQITPTLGSVMSYRNQVDKGPETNWSKTKNIDEDLDSILENGKTNYITNTKLDAIIHRKFQELEKFAPKTKGALKSFQSEEQQRSAESITVTGPMDEFVERKQQRIKRPVEQSVKQSGKIKKRSKSSKKRVRNAWYENDSSDEFRTAAKTEDIGVGISKSQRSCSKGKQNLFAELSTSSDSEYERNNVDYVTANEQRSLKTRKNLKKLFDADIEKVDNQRIVNESEFDNEDQIANNWNQMQEDAVKNDHDAAKSESEMSDHSLVIDERKTDEARNSDDDADNQYNRTFELDDLYREDSSDAETEVEENEELTIEARNKAGTQVLDKNATLQTKITATNAKNACSTENELISLEEALNLLDQPDNLDSKTKNGRVKNNIVNGTTDEVSNDEINQETQDRRLSPVEMRDEREEADDDVPVLPEKLSSNEKPQKESDHNLPLHVFLSRKVQESKKRKQQQLDKLREEQERILMDFQPTRRQRKCAIGKQGLLAEISSSDEESYIRDNSRKGNDHDKSRKKRESKEKRKERYLEKKHEQMIAKEQKAIEEEILREVGKKKEILALNENDVSTNAVERVVSGQIQKKKHQTKEKHKKGGDENIKENAMYIGEPSLDDSEDNRNKLNLDFSEQNNTETNDNPSSISPKRKKLSKSPAKSKKVLKPENGKISPSKKSKEATAEKSKKTSANNKDSKERKSSNGKHDSGDEELKTTKSWNKVEEGVGVAIGRRKRTAALQLYYWSSSSDEEEVPEPLPAPEEEEDDRQEQHGWIVGDSHKRMITMLAMEKQLKEKRRRSEDEFEPGKAKSKKHRNSTS